MKAAEVTSKGSSQTKHFGLKVDVTESSSVSHEFLKKNIKASMHHESNLHSVNTFIAVISIIFHLGFISVGACV